MLPVTAKFTAVKNNGAGFASYFIALSLWVGITLTTVQALLVVLGVLLGLLGRRWELVAESDFRPLVSPPIRPND